MSGHTPSTLELAAALRCLSAAGFSLHVPGVSRLELVSCSQLARLWDLSERKARDIITSLPGSVRIDGGDLRARVSELEAYLDAHPIRPALRAAA